MVVETFNLGPRFYLIGLTVLVLGGILYQMDFQLAAGLSVIFGAILFAVGILMKKRIRD